MSAAGSVSGLSRNTDAKPAARGKVLRFPRCLGAYGQRRGLARPRRPPGCRQDGEEAQARPGCGGMIERRSLRRRERKSQPSCTDRLTTACSVPRIRSTRFMAVGATTSTNLEPFICCKLPKIDRQSIFPSSEFPRIAKHLQTSNNHHAIFT